MIVSVVCQRRRVASSLRPHFETAITTMSNDGIYLLHPVAVFHVFQVTPSLRNPLRNTLIIRLARKLWRLFLLGRWSWQLWRCAVAHLALLQSNVANFRARRHGLRRSLLVILHDYVGRIAIRMHRLLRPHQSRRRLRNFRGRFWLLCGHRGRCIAQITIKIKQK